MKIRIAYLIKITSAVILLIGLLISAWQIYRYYSFSNLSQSGLAIDQALPKLNEPLINKFLSNFNQTNNTPINGSVKNIFSVPINQPTKE